MPTDTKKMVPKRFFTGSVMRMTRSASTVSAMMLPMTKAPKAELKPTAVEISAIMQHRPNDTTSRVSSVISLRVERKKVGITKRPTTNQSTRKKPIFSSEPNIAPPSGSPPTATALSMTIITTPRMSSRMSVDMTRPAKRCCPSPMSSNAL